MALKPFSRSSRSLRRVTIRRQSIMERTGKILRQITSKLTALRLLKGIALLFVIFPMSLLIVREVRRDPLIIDPFSVPKSFSDAGLTPEVLARRVGDKLRDIETLVHMRLKEGSLKSRQSKQNLTKTELSPDDDLQTAEQQTSLPQIEFPGTKLRLTTLVEILRTLTHRSPEHLGGDIVLPLAAAFTPQPHQAPPHPEAKVTVYYQQESGRQTLTDAFRQDDPDTLVEKAAELALHQVNPYLLALYLKAQDQSQKASDLLREMTEGNKRTPDQRVAALILWGNILLDQHKFDEAINKYSKAIALAPNEDHAYYDWGVALYNQHLYEEAIGKFSKATELNRGFAAAYKSWGDALDELKRYSEADTKYRRAADLDPNQSQFLLYNNWGMVLSKQGRYEEAFAKFRKATELDPKDVGPYANWGHALFEQGKYGEGASKFSEAAAIDPNVSYVYGAWGDMLFLQGKYEEATVKYKRAIELDPHDARTYGNFGAALEKLGRISEANRMFAEALRLKAKPTQPKSAENPQATNTP